jgi:hypothetical protein
MSQERIDEVVGRERREEAFPAEPAFAPEDEEEPCQCPACRRRRRSSRQDSEQYELFDDLFDDDEEEGELEDVDDLDDLDDSDFEALADMDDLESALDELPLPPGLKGVPRDVILPLLEVFQKYRSEKGRAPSLDELEKRYPELYERLEEAYLQRALEEVLGPPPKRSKKGSGKRKKR